MKDYAITTKIVWQNSNSTVGDLRLTVELDPYDDMVVRYEHPGCEDQVLEMHEPVWKALMEMMSEVTP